MDKFLDLIVIPIVLSIWYIYIAIILPKLRCYRKLYLSDWGCSLVQPIKNIIEYKSICKKENESTKYFTIISILFVSFLIIFLSGFVSVAQDVDREAGSHQKINYSFSSCTGWVDGSIKTSVTDRNITQSRKNLPQSNQGYPITRTPP